MKVRPKGVNLNLKGTLESEIVTEMRAMGIAISL